MEIEKQEYEAIAREIHSDNSPVGIDAKKTHILILAMLRKMNERLDAIEKKMELIKAQNEHNAN